MARKGQVAKRDVLPDPVYNSKTISKLINNIMLDGKKGVAQKIVYGAFDRVAALYFNQIKERGCMFEVGDRVFYGVVGVCEVEDIAAPPIKGIDGKYYYLQPVYDDKGIIYSPVDSKKVSMRTIITKEEAQTFLERARNCKSDELLNQKITPNQYDEMVKSQDTEKLMHLVRFLYDIKNERAKELRKMKSADSRMLVTARKLLYGELAVALGKDYSEMSDLLDQYLGQN